ncbi:MAG: type II toxin-antitoxin system RelE/ParE family toxin [Armatimonadota bacterium]
MYQAVFSKRAARFFLKIPLSDAKKIKKAIIKLQKKPDSHGVIKLKVVPLGHYRYRVGDYRIIFDINNEMNILEILDISRRSENTYKK